MRTLTDLEKDLAGDTTEASPIDFAIEVLATVAEHLSRQDTKTKRKVASCRRGASVLAEFKTSLQFAPVPLLTPGEGA